MQKNNVVIVVCIIVAVVAFVGGMKYGDTSARVCPGQGNMALQGGGMGTFPGRTGARVVGGMRGGFVVGDVLTSDGKTLTVKLQDGGSKIVFLSASTTISMSTQGSVGDLSAGKSVMVQGNTNSDGSITASMIQIRPVGAPIPR